MARQDLLALGPDDLATLGNRGLVKRAQRDLEAGAGPARVEESAEGTVTADWPDGAVVTLRADDPLSDRACSCAAVTVCRHLIGTVLAYQARTPRVAELDDPWDPGEIDESKLPLLDRPFDGVAELYRGAKPMARLEPLGVTLRFLVRHDARYVQCDCSGPSPCPHVAPAVRAFRELPAGRSSGLVFPNEKRAAVSSDVVEDVEAGVRALFLHGLAALPPTEMRRWESMPGGLRRRSLPWPADVAGEMLVSFDQYRAADARFDPADLARLGAELIVRVRAAQAATGTAPQLYIRGPANSGEATELGFARLSGLGCHVTVKRKSTVLSVPMQELGTGTIVVARRETVRSEERFAELAAAPFAKGISLGLLGEANLLIQGARRGSNAELLPARSRLSATGSMFEWEKLRAPVLLEEFAELAAHRESQPPAFLRPRRLAEDVHVLPVAAAEGVELDAAGRRLTASLVDRRGARLTAVFPFYSAGAAGFGQLRQVLEAEKLLFVSGIVRPGLTLLPSAVVYEKDGRRQCLQPWIASGPATGEASEWGEAGAIIDPLAAWCQEVMAALGDAAVSGLEQGDPITARRWRGVVEQGERLGWARWLAPVRRLASELDRRGTSVGEKAAEAAVELAVVSGFGATLA